MIIIPWGDEFPQMKINTRNLLQNHYFQHPDITVTNDSNPLISGAVDTALKHQAGINA
ncbi:hypothetical protein N836_25755 [Leptolyngbya sp. Heron Island J]|nr:hypothetical protein N836_25755 [Leptolyngbya sp. Heron Island J]